MAWELCNEPRCEGDFSGSILQDWVEQQAEFLKSLDPFHLLTIGAEGFLGSSTPGPSLQLRQSACHLSQSCCKSKYMVVEGHDI